MICVTVFYDIICREVTIEKLSTHTMYKGFVTGVHLDCIEIAGLDANLVDYFENGGKHIALHFNASRYEKCDFLMVVVR